jgi:DNA polymerase elongation subunit (family B)/predicted RNA-binding Zn-ribbon protein involved in translation (DUF1610 family)
MTRKKTKHTARILLLDIETAPNRVYTWGLWNQNVGINQIEEAGYTLSWAAKWYGEKEVMFASTYHHGDAMMLTRIHDLLNEADVVVHFNGKKFDIPVLNKEFIQAGLAPPSPYDQVDIYQIVKSTFKFASNKLDYVAQALGLGTKVQTKGMELWTGCMAGDEDSWRTMRRYNIQDVRLLEKLYDKVKGWIRSHPNLALYVEDADSPTCPNCGSHKVKSNGIRRTRVQKYRRYHCEDCGAWSRGRLRTEKPGEGVLV